MSSGTIMSYPASQGALPVWMELWRAFWLDLPLAWLDYVDRTATALVTMGAHAAPQQAVALGIGCEPSLEDVLDV